MESSLKITLENQLQRKKYNHKMRIFLTRFDCIYFVPVPQARLIPKRVFASRELTV